MTLHSANQSLVGHALLYAARGWPVMPVHGVEGGRCTCGEEACSSPGKHPRTKHGLKEASADLAIIERWWKRWPDANVAIVTGAASGLVVLDVDGYHGGDETLADLVAQHGPLPATLQVITGGDGMHYLFAHPGAGEEIRNTAGKKLGQGLDVRGDGGYIVAAPSLHASGRRYEWVDVDVVPAPLPAWMLDRLRKPPAAPAPAHVPAGPRPRGGGTAYGLEALARELAEVRAAGEGTRNDTLFESTAALAELVAGGELEEGLVVGGLALAAAAIGLGEREAAATIKSGMERGRQHPRAAPERPDSPAGERRRPWEPSGRGELSAEPPEDPLDGPAPVEGPEDDQATGSGEHRGGRTSPATQLVQLALERYDVGRSHGGDLFAVPVGARHVRLLRGGRHSLRAELADFYSARTGRAASSSALADAMLVLEGKAQGRAPVEVALRVARHDGRVLLDLANGDDTVLSIGGDGWSIADPSPVLFRRTELTSPLPMPVTGGALDELRGFLNVTDESWPLLVGWLVAALLPEIPHPIALLTGEQGAGKSTAGRLLVSLLDPSPAPLRASPKDAEEWAIVASGSWVVGIDNVSSVPTWLSDALCRAVTGDGLVRRRLYTDADLTVLAIRRVMLLTSIDAGSLRGDLVDRLVPVELERIGRGQRREDAAISRAFAEAQPRILGALFDTLARVLAALPLVQLDELPRMADFARVLAAVDVVLETRALHTYLSIGERAASDLVDGDPVAAALRRFVDRRDGAAWRGPTRDLFELLAVEHPPKTWPPDATRFGGRLKRAAPALRAVGIQTLSRRSKAGAIIDVWREAGDAEGDAVTLSVTPDEPQRHPRLWKNGAGQGPSGDSGDAGEAEDPLSSPCRLGEGEIDEAPPEVQRRSASSASPAPLGGRGPCVSCGQPTGRTHASGAWWCSRCQLADSDGGDES